MIEGEYIYNSKNAWTIGGNLLKLRKIILTRNQSTSFII